MLELTNDQQQADSPTLGSPRQVQPLLGENEAEVLDFLSAHPLLTFVMTGWIRDNGLVSQLNRGTFYGSRNQRGELDGVALIGHVTLFETKSESALAAFAKLTNDCSSAFVVMGETHRLNSFLEYFPKDRRPRQVCREELFEQRSKEPVEDVVGCLRRATPEEVDLVVPVHAAMTLEETGVNPLETDPLGFRKRCFRRIQQGRVWVCIKDEQLLFKADVISDLPEVNYLEGIYVIPERRGQGFGTRCMKQLTNTLLTHTKSVCLLAKEDKSAAQACYRSAGYKLREHYETMFLEQETDQLTN
jgi:ribosomal protein S18 acetylase RimI-like enzyme